MRLPVARFHCFQSKAQAAETFRVTDYDTFAVDRIASDHRHLIGRAASHAVCRSTRASFDDLVGAAEQCQRYLEAERLGGLQIDESFRFL